MLDLWMFWTVTILFLAIYQRDKLLTSSSQLQTCGRGHGTVVDCVASVSSHEFLLWSEKKSDSPVEALGQAH